MTGPDPDERALAHALGAMSAADQAELEREPTLRREVDAIAEALTSFALALPRTSAPAGLRARLLASARGPARFAPFVDRLARMLDLAADAARALLARIDSPGAWQPAPAPNIHLIHLVGGPAVAGLDVGFVRVAAGTVFPPHRHLGDEQVLVLEGSYCDSTGPTVRAGEQVSMPAGSEHHFTAGRERDLIYAVVVAGVEIEGIPAEALRRPPP